MSNATTNYTAMAAAMQSDLSAATTDNGASAPVQGIVNFLNGNNAPPSNSTLLPISNSDIIRSTLRFWGSLYLAAVVVFCFLRRFYPKLFDLRSWVEEMKCDTAKNAEYGWVNWLWKVFYVDDDELMNSCGMDATCFLRALRFGRRLSYIGCINAIWLLPLYVTAPQSAETFYITDPLVVASLSHLSTGSKRFLGTVIAAYITFVFSMFLIVNEFQWFAKYRHKFLALRIPQNYAVYVSGIPEGLQSSSELHKYFEQGVDVLEAHIAMNIPNLEAKVARRENIVRRLEHAMALEKKTGTVKTHRKLSKRGAIEKVETVPKLEEKLRKLNRSIAVETGKIMNSHDPRRRMLSRQDRSKKLSTVFVDEMRTTGTRNIVEEVDEDEMDNELTAILRGRPEEEALERQDFEESSEGAFGVQDVDVEAVTIAYRSGSNGSLDPIVEAVGENNSEKEECESLESDSDRLHVAEEACLPVSLDENYDAPVFATVCVKSGAISAAGTESEEPNHDRVALTSHIPKGEFRTCKAASSSYCAERSVEKEIEAGSDADDQGSCKYSGCFRKDIDHAGDPTTDTLDQSNYLVCDTKRPASSSTALSTDLEDGLMDAKTFHHASNVHSDNLSSQNFLKQKAKEFVVENKVCNGEVPRPAIFDSASSAEHLGTMMSFEGKFLNESSSETLTRTSGSLPFLSLHEHSLSDMPGNLIQTDSLFIDAWEFAPEPVEGPDDALMIETAPDQSNTQNHLTFHGDPRRRFLPALSSSSSISSGKDRRKSLRQSFVPVSKVVTAGSRVASSTMVTAGSTVLRSSRAATNSVTKAVSVGSRVAGASVVTAGSTVKKGSLAAGGAIVRVAQDAHVDKLIHHAGEKGIKTATAIGTHLVTSAATVVPVLAANQSGEPRDAGFVVFKTLYSTQLALQMIHHPRPFTMDVQEAPDPADIFWRNVGMPHRARRTGRILSIGATAALCVFWSIPTAAIASLAQVNSLKASLPRLGELLDRRPGLDHFMELLAPLLLLILNQTVLPAILKYFATWEGHVSSGILESSVCLKLGAFTIIQTFFVSAISGGIFSQVTNMLRNPSLIVNLLANSLPAQSSYFLQMLLTSTFLTMGMQLLRIIPLGAAFLRRFVGPNLTKKERRRAYMGINPLEEPPEFQMSQTEAQLLLYVMVFFVYAPIAPITSFFLLFCFALLESGYRYQFIHNYPIAFETGGRLWMVLMRLTLASMLIAQVTLAGLMILKKSIYGTPFIAPLIIITILFTLYVNAEVSRVTQNLPTRDCVVVDTRNDDLDFEFVRNAYLQPALQNVLVEPEFDESEEEDD